MIAMEIEPRIRRLVVVFVWRAALFVVTVAMIVFALAGCGVDQPSVDHTANVGAQPGTLAAQDEGCHEIQTEISTIERGLGSCAADDGFACSYAVRLGDGTVGCCSISSGDPTVSGDDVETWHTCGGGQ